MIVSGLGIQSPAPEIQIREVTTASGKKIVRTLQVPEPQLPAEIPDSIKRRMSRLAKMYFATLFEAVDDAFGVERKVLRTQPERVGLVVGTVFGNLNSANDYFHRIQVDGAAGASPTLFAGSIHNSLASQLSIALGNRGPTSTTSTMNETVLGAFRVAWDWLSEEVVDHVVVVIGEEVSDFHLYAVAHLENPPVLGEGVVAFVLSRNPLNKNYGRLVDVKWPSQQSNPEFQQKYGYMVSDLAFEIAAQCLRRKSKTGVHEEVIERIGIRVVDV